MGRKIISRKPEIDAPLKPDPKKPTKGGRKRTRIFAMWIDAGLTPYEAYLKAGFPVRGVRGPSGSYWEKGPLIEHAQASAQRLAQSTRIQGWIAAWNVPADQLLEQMKAESAFVLRAALQCRDEDGNPTARALNAADSILDRTGLGRGTKVALEHRNKGRSTLEQDDLRREVLEAMRREGVLIDGTAEKIEAIDVESVPLLMAASPVANGTDGFDPSTKTVPS